ncbi:MAG: hypothetical protein HDT30_13405 [Clostridiales bacterium]|nr:hypothetical protein [Clostridiales bacterium]
MRRSFHAFMEKEDLENTFMQFQNNLQVYYAPTYSDNGPVTIADITQIADFGINFCGSHIGNNQFRVFFQNRQCVWRQYQCPSSDNKKMITCNTTFCDENTELIDLDLGGIYKEDNIFPTEIGTIYYENENVKKLFSELKKCFRKNSKKIVNGYYIGNKAFANRKKYRFCTIDIKSPQEFDLQID